MFKTLLAANKHWWVPEERSWVLAVQIETADQYQEAIRDKLDTLLEQAGLERAKAAARMAAGDWASTIHMETLAELRANLAHCAPVAELIQSGDPRWADPAPEEVAKDVIESQAELTLVDFLEAAPPAFSTDSTNR